MQNVLFLSGLALLLIGLFTGLVVPRMRNPQRGLASHLEGHVNGILLVVLGLLWPYVEVTRLWEVIAVTLLIYGAYVNWFATFTASRWSTAGHAPSQPSRDPSSDPSRDAAGPAATERFISVLLITVAVADIAGVAIVIVGVATP